MPQRSYSQSVYLGHYSDPPWVVQDFYGVPLRYSDNMIEGFQGHYGYPNFPAYSDVGGGLQLIGWRRSAAVCNVDIRGGGPYWPATYSGKFLMDIPYPGPMADLYSPAAWGAEAYAKMKPTEPEYQVLNSIYELREVTQLLKVRVSNFKDLGGLFLNGQFGWLATLGDLRNLIKAQRNAQKRLAQLLRDNGRPVRRKIKLVENETDEGTEMGDLWGYHNPSFVTQFFSHPPRQLTRKVLRDSVWGSAQFRYWLPEGPKDIEYKSRMLDHLYGDFVTPQVIYNMIPWSWLVDWFTNLGDVIANLDAGVADRLAADRFYMMREVERTFYSERSVGFYNKQGVPVEYSGVAQGTSFSKVRIKGSPFGLGWNQNDLSPMQLAILGALGLSRV